MTSSIRALLCITVSSFVTIAATAASAPFAGAAAVHTAAGVVRVEASGLAWASLDVPRDARLSLDYYDESALTGPRFSSGRGFAAVVVVPDVPDGVAGALTAVRLPKGPGQIQRFVSMGGRDSCAFEPRGCPVPAGPYRVFVVTESKVVVTLRFEGLSGSTRIVADEPATGEISAPEPEYSYEVPYTVTGLDATGMGFAPSTTGRAVVFSAFWFRGARDGVAPIAPADEPLFQIGLAGTCLYFGEPPAVGAFAPGCPTGENTGAFATQRAFDDFSFMQWNQASGVPPGTYGLGNYAIHTGIFDPGFIGFWIEAEGARE